MTLPFVEVTSATVFCPGEPQDVSVQLMNLGLENLTFATLGVYAGGELLQSTFWTGNLETYAIEEVIIPDVYFPGSTEYTVEIIEAIDSNLDNNTASGAVQESVESAMLVQVEIMVDNWPQEIGWSIADDMQATS